MAVDLCSGGRGVATSLLGPSWEGEKPPWGTCSGERGREEQGCPGPAGRRRSGEALELKCSQRFLKGKKKIPSLHSVNTAALARRVTGSDGLCVPPFSPQEGAAGVSGDAGEKAMAADPPSSCQNSTFPRSRAGKRRPAAVPRDRRSLRVQQVQGRPRRRPLRDRPRGRPRRQPFSFPRSAALGLAGRLVGGSGRESCQEIGRLKAQKHYGL